MNARVKELFHELADRTSEARAQYFTDHEVDPETRREVEELLAFDAGASTFLMRDISGAASLSFAQIEAGGWRCGPYQLLKVIGRGGMGAVYLAERADGEVTQRVAVKLLPPGAGDLQRARFLQERQILASLVHPNIARMLDAGHLDNGQPFLAMEFVEGTPIDVYAADLNLRQKITLFLKVCSAVSYLHRNLVVHRDLKPRNILVTPDGEPKLLDFGIAKMLDVATDSTVTSLRMLTPDYASPEQVTGGPVSTATDVYSLGAVLYNLLTGKAPREFGDASPEAIAAVITRQDVTRPSTWSSALRGDLECILLKAMRNDPLERYTTVEQFADDLQAFHDSRADRARSGNAWYRARKFAKRYWVPVTLTAAAVAAVAGGIVATTVQARIARKQRDYALRQWSRAEAINDLNDFITSETPSAAIGPALEHAERVIRRQSAMGDANRVELLMSIGRFTGVENGDTRALQVLEDAYKLSRPLKDFPTRAKAACALGGMLARSTNLARAEALVQEGLRDASAEPEFVLDRSYCLLRGAVVSRATGNATEAITRIQEALALLKRSPYQSPSMNVNALTDLGEAYRVAGKNREACAIYEQAFAQLVALGREDVGAYPGTLLYRWSLALALLGRPLEAEKLSSRAIALFSSGGDAVRPLFLVHHARLMRDLGRLEEAANRADAAYGRALQADTAAVVNQALLLRASIYRMRGDLDSATRILAELEPRLVHDVAPGNIWFASLHSEQALVAEARGDRQRALSLMNDSLAIAEAASRAGRQGADLVPALLVQRSDVERELDRSDEAEADAARALLLFQQAAQPGTSSSLVGQAFLALGRAREAKHQRGPAAEAFRSAEQHFTGALGPDHADTRTARSLVQSSTGS